MPLQLRRGTDAQRSGVVFAAGELIYVTDTDALYVGDGATAGGVAVANLGASDIRNISAGVLTGGSHSGITFTYDGTNIDAVVDPDLSNYQGVIRASAFNGTLVDDSSTVLVDAVDSKINLDGTVKGDIIPDADSAYDIGSAGAKFRDLYLSGSSLYLGSAQVTAVGSAINLPAGSTVNGVPIGSGSGTGDGVIEGSTYKINIAASDSSLMVNTDLESVTASGGFFGNVTGDLSGNVTGNVNGNVTGDVTGTLDGSVYNSAGSILLVDGSTSKIVGDVNNTNVDTSFITAQQLDVSNISIVAGVSGQGIVLNGYDISSVGTLGVSTVSATTSVDAPEVTASTYFVDAVEVASVGDVLLVGTDTNTSSIRLKSNDNASFEVYGVSNASFDGGAPIVFNAHSTSLAAPTKVNAEATLGSFAFNGYNGTVQKLGALMLCAVKAGEDTTGAPYIASDFLFAVSDGTNEPDLVLTLRSDKVAEAPCFKATPFADTTARDAAIPTPEAGMIIYLTSTNKLQAYNGTAWTDLY